MNNTKNNKDNTKNNKKKIGWIAGIAVVLVILVLFAVGNRSKSEEDAGQAAETAVSTVGEEQSAAETEAADVTETADPAAETDQASASGEAAENAASETESTENGNDDGIAQERMEACYENWLGAAVITAISMRYLDFEPGTLYCKGETELSSMESSEGIYYTFSSEGTEYCVYAYPLEEERTEKGTVDVYTDVTGYAAFDLADPTEIPEDFAETDVEEMNTLIGQLGQVMVYEN